MRLPTSRASSRRSRRRSARRHRSGGPLGQGRARRFSARAPPGRGPRPRRLARCALRRRVARRAFGGCRGWYFEPPPSRPALLACDRISTSVTARQRRHTAPAAEEVSSTQSCSHRPDWTGSAVRTTGCRSTSWCRRRGRAASRSRRARATTSVAAAAGVLTDTAALSALTAERALVAALDATCNTPVGAHAEPARRHAAADRVRGPAGRIALDPRRARWSGRGSGRPRRRGRGAPERRRRR